MDKEKMRDVACLMLVDMAADGQNIESMAHDLRTTFAFGTEAQFNKVCRQIGAAYKRKDKDNG